MQRAVQEIFALIAKVGRFSPLTYSPFISPHGVRQADDECRQREYLVSMSYLEVRRTHDAHAHTPSPLCHFPSVGSGVQRAVV